jgi:putative membrane protein
MTPRAPGRHLLGQVAVSAALITVLAHISWILVPEMSRDAVTILSVAAFATASISHAAASRGIAWAARYAVLALGIGWTAEAVGTTTGLPFGEYLYTDSLGPKLGPVPLVIPLAWAMMAYPVLLAARAVSRRPAVQVLYGAALLTSWDLFLDPQMVAEGHWVWADPSPALPGIPGIPALNFAGWFLVGLVLFSACTALLPQDPPGERRDDRLPGAMLLWVAASNILASAVFWQRPSVALVGGAAMGVLVLVWLRAPGVRAGLGLPPDLPADVRAARRRLVGARGR